MLEVILIAAILTVLGGGGADDDGRSTPADGVTAQQYEVCYPDYDTGDGEEVCKQAWPGEHLGYGQFAELEGTSPSGFPIPTWDPGDPPPTDVSGLDVTTYLMAAGRRCELDDRDEPMTVYLVRIPGGATPPSPSGVAPLALTADGSGVGLKELPNAGGLLLGFDCFETTQGELEQVFVGARGASVSATVHVREPDEATICEATASALSAASPRVACES